MERVFYGALVPLNPGYGFATISTTALPILALVSLPPWHYSDPPLHWIHPCHRIIYIPALLHNASVTIQCRVHWIQLFHRPDDSRLGMATIYRYIGNIDILRSIYRYVGVYRYIFRYISVITNSHVFIFFPEKSDY